MPTNQFVGQSQPSMNYNFKTAKCKYYDENGCKYGTKCIFAHGDQELRTPVHNVYSKKQNVENLQLMQLQWQQQMMGNVYAQNTEFLNTKRMIQYIIDRFKKLHANQENAQKLLSEAEAQLNGNDIQTSSAKIQVCAT